MKKRTGDDKIGGGSATYTAILSISMVTILVLFGLFILLNLETESSNMNIRDRYQELSDDWRLVTDTRDEVVDLPVWVDLAPGESVTLSRELAISIPNNYAAVSRNYHQTIVFSVDGDEFYRYPSESRKTMSSIVSDDWNMISITREMWGKTLEIEIVARDQGFQGYLKPVYFGEDNALIQHIRSKRMFYYIMGIGVIATGLIMVLLDFVNGRYYRTRAQSILGMIFISIGMWGTNRAIMPLFMVGSSLKFLFSFLTFLISPTLIFMYIGEKFKERNQRLVNAGLIASLLMIVGIFIASTVIQYPIDLSVKYIFYFLIIAGLYDAYVHWKVAFGEEAEGRSRVDVVSDKAEFIAIVILLMGFMGDRIYNMITKVELWSELGLVSRVTFGIFAAFHIGIMVYRTFEGNREREVIQKQLNESRIELMVGQIQPHFMFNTLSSIRTLIKLDPEAAYDMIYDFSNYLRTNVDNINNLSGIKLSSELEHIKTYVNIERVRFGDRVSVEYEIEKDDFLVPPLSIQPLVENAIKHGICKKIEGGTVRIKSYGEQGFNVVEVEDDGVGMEQDVIDRIFRTTTPGYVDMEELSKVQQEKVENTTLRDGKGELIDIDRLSGSIIKRDASKDHASTGMKNIILRLREMSDAAVEIESKTGVGTKIVVKFPVIE